jgi:translation initiation factor IF-3
VEVRVFSTAPLSRISACPRRHALPEQTLPKLPICLHWQNRGHRAAHLSLWREIPYMGWSETSGAIPIRPPMIRRPQGSPMPMNGPRFNEFIQSPKVRVIDQDGENLGVMYTREAFEQAQAVGLDLVEVSPNADPPVAKFLDVGKFKYEAQKKANLARKSQKTQEIKEIKMRPNIDDHDYDTKMKKIIEFIGEGDKVKVTLRFRGRELSHGQLGMQLLQRVQADAAETAKVEAYPRMEGRQMLMVLSPK